MDTPLQKKHHKIVWFLFAFILLGPIAFAWVMVQKANIYQLRTNNHGDLLSPAPNISHTPFYDVHKKESFQGQHLAGRWWLMYVAPQKCTQECQEILYNMRQIHTALGRESSRLERLFIVAKDCPVSVCELFINEYYPQLLKASMKQTDFDQLLDPFSNTTEREMIGELYIIDPKGNIMMHYGALTPSQGILQDLKRLLKVSKIG